MKRTLLLRAQKAITATPASSSHTGAQKITLRNEFSGKSITCESSYAFHLNTSLPSTSSRSEDTAPRLYEPRAEDVIRATNRFHNRTKWGFVTVDARTSPKRKWDELMKRIKDDARKHLKDDPDLFESMDWPVIEDPGKLDGAHYAVAAVQFGDWVMRSHAEEARRIALLPPSPTADVEGPDGWGPGMDPRHETFIYANEDVVNSVVDHPKGIDSSHGKGYFVYLVNYAGLRTRKMVIDMFARQEAGEESWHFNEQLDYGAEDVAGLEMEDPDMVKDDEEWRELRVKFRACEIVPGHALVEDEMGWENGFDEPGEGIYEPGSF